MDRRSLLRTPSALATAFALATLALLALPAPARADIEARCPSGFNTISPPGTGGGERPVVVCVRQPMQINVSELATVIAPGGPEETNISNSLSQQMSQTGTVTASPFRNETIGGRAARVSDLSGTAPSEAGGQPTRFEGSVILMRAGAASTVLVIAMTPDASRGSARQTVRTMIPTIAGLDGSPAPARVSATCPAGLSAQQANPQGPGGMRRAVLCADGEGARRIDVLESRLPVRTPAEARPMAESMANSIGRQLAALGGSASAGPTETVTFGPGLTGFVTPVHGEARDPRVPQGAPPGAGGITFEGLVAVLPTSTGGHAQVTASSQNENAEALRTRLRAFVTGNLRLDGSGAPGAAAAGDGGTGAGDATGTSASAPPQPRERPPVDPNAPIWNPNEEEGAGERGGAAGARGRGGRGGSGSSQSDASEGESESARTGRYATYGFLAVVGLLVWWLLRRR